MQKQTISTHHLRIVDYSYSTSTVMFALLILLLLACVRRESKRMMCWGRSTCRRHQRPSPVTEGSYANIRGDVPMTVVHWCSTPKRWWIIMVHHFLQCVVWNWAEAQEKSGCLLQPSHQSRNWRIALALYMVEVSISGGGGVLAEGW